MSELPIAIAVRGIERRFQRFVLRDVDFDLSRGSVLGLIGGNGAGKSTLLRILMGLVRADRGEVTILGRRMPDEECFIKERVGFVSEDMALYAGKSLRWHMDLVASFHPGWDAARASELAARLDLDLDRPTRGFSRGQQVKALLLLALSRRAEVLILDEPTAGLDPLARLELMELLRAERDAGSAIIFSSHHGEDVAALADDVAFLHGGRIVESGPLAEVLGSDRSLAAALSRRVGRMTVGSAA
jgi:ABC-2 type transport system ATP-binding protein